MDTATRHESWPVAASDLPDAHDPTQVRDRLHHRIAALVDHWRAISPVGRLPGRQHFEPMAVVSLLPNLWLLDVIDGGIDFRVRILGTDIEDVGTWAMTGATLQETFPSREAGVLCHELRRVVKTGRPVWHENGRYFTPARMISGVERVALPLARDGKTVDMVLGMTVFGWERPRDALRLIDNTKSR